MEYWAHEASLVPVETHPLLRWRMARARTEAWGGPRRIAAERPDLVKQVLDDVREHGPLTAREIDDDVERSQDDNWGWNWSDVKRALEFLFFAGEITVAGRNGQFERLYDVPERVLPGRRAGRADPDARGRAPRAGPDRGAGARGGDRAVPEGLLPDRAGADHAGDRRAGRVRRAAAGLDPGLEAAGVPAARGEAAAPGERPRAGQPVRLAGVRADPDRGGCSASGTGSRSTCRAETGVRLLRAALPARRPAGGPGRPEGRPAGGRPAGAVRARRAGRAGGDRAASWPPSWSSWPAGSGWPRSG